VRILATGRQKNIGILEDATNLAFDTLTIPIIYALRSVEESLCN